MIIVPEVTITLDRSGMPGSPAPLIFYGATGLGGLVILRYMPPAQSARTTYMPDAGDVDGSEAIGSAWQQAVLAWDWRPDGATSETIVQAARNEVLAAIGQFEFEVTTRVSDAPAEVWQADRGSMALGGSDGRQYVDLANLIPQYAVTVPVYPIPTVVP
jgi:hypothetical protein